MAQRECVGVVKIIDSLNRIIIPSDMRKEIGVNAGDEVEVRIVQLNKKEKVIEIRKKGN